ncbi:hypothetical protein A6U86_20980 [Rhizobium sp. AC27/96]|nr:hypothetical protein A6U86_20980 [Rhizobium sp. AC27/96]
MIASMPIIHNQDNQQILGTDRPEISNFAQFFYKQGVHFSHEKAAMAWRAPWRLRKGDKGPERG